MEMKGDKSHVTDHWVKQEQNHGTVHIWAAWFDKRRPEPGKFPLKTSNKLAQVRGHLHASITPQTCHLVSTNDAILLFCRSKLPPHFFIAPSSSLCHIKVYRRDILFDHVSTHYHYLYRSRAQGSF